jgi:hypothetical protein
MVVLTPVVEVEVEQVQLDKLETCLAMAATD